MHRNGRPDHQKIGHAHDARDRIAVPQEIVVEVRVIGRVDDVGRIGKEKCIAVGRRPDHVLGPDIIRRAKPVFDHELAVKATRQPIGDQPRHHVDRPASGKAGNDLHWPGRIVKREGIARNDRQRGCTGCQLHEPAARNRHGITPKTFEHRVGRWSANSSFFYFVLQMRLGAKAYTASPPSPETGNAGCMVAVFAQCQKLTSAGRNHRAA